MLYVHDRMKQELRALTEGLKAKAKAAAGLGSAAGSTADPSGSPPRDCIREALDRSRDVCLTLYKPPRRGPSAWRDEYNRYPAEERNLEPAQLAAYSALHAWRDATARASDESVAYVASRSLLRRSGGSSIRKLRNAP